MFLSLIRLKAICLISTSHMYHNTSHHGEAKIQILVGRDIEVEYIQHRVNPIIAMKLNIISKIVKISL